MLDAPGGRRCNPAMRTVLRPGRWQVIHDPARAEARFLALGLDAALRAPLAVGAAEFGPLLELLLQPGRPAPGARPLRPGAFGEELERSLTALGYAVVPTLEEKATLAGEAPPPSAFRDALRRDGWKWLLGELAVMIVLGLASMWLDHVRLRRLQIGAGQATMPSVNVETTLTPPGTVSHDSSSTAGDRAEAPG